MTNQIPGASAKILIAGFGALGRNMLKQAPHANITSLNRASNSPAPHHIQADLLKPETLLDLPQFDYVVFTATPDERTESAYKTTYVEATNNLLFALSKQAVKRFYFVSSTSVYGQHQGETVDEVSDTAATSFSGKAIRRGEELVNENAIPSTLIRFGGIYGNGRSMLIRHVKAGVDVANQPAPITNRIHEDDCAGLLLHLVAIAQQGTDLAPCYVAVDDDGSNKAAVYQFIAEQLNCPQQVNLLPERPSNLGKRCNNQLMKKTGYQLLYPSYRSGYLHMINRMKQESS
ncbi:NAD-dependent epimerase/dehydratase family protein [Neiella marina]|uniref:NAD-dependent epimerase/dehydratase family protein n=1 Tax=Neiella holothuriorum TaxID=2870530 RepID=A0ABS7EGP9_9GAMM|nr:NAD-dependent epimerase/dehydratase family protein [Neiella holothuriorum]MBW8191522.1 NAD-dependent epimerase/dehydratase family protein [Neiella holothuriorum]